MSEEQVREEQTTEEAWRQVGRQFEALGESLANAFRTAWKSEETRQQVQGMREGLEAMMDKVNQAFKDEQLREEADKAADSVRVAGKQSWEEARPHLVSALNSIDAELQRIIRRMEQQEAGPETGDAESATDETPEEA